MGHTGVVIHCLMDNGDHILVYCFYLCIEHCINAEYEG